MKRGAEFTQKLVTCHFFVFFRKKARPSYTPVGGPHGAHVVTSTLARHGTQHGMGHGTGREGGGDTALPNAVVVLFLFVRIALQLPSCILRLLAHGACPPRPAMAVVVELNPTADAV